MKRKPNINWTKDQIAFIKKSYETKTDKWIGEQLNLERGDVQNFRFNNHLSKRSKGYGISVNIDTEEEIFDVDTQKFWIF